MEAVSSASRRFKSWTRNPARKKKKKSKSPQPGKLVMGCVEEGERQR